MSATADTLFGATIGFGTSTFAAKLTDLNFDGVSRPAIDTTELSTTVASTGEIGGRTFIPGGISDGGSLSIDLQFNPDDNPPIDAAAETITITFAASGGNGTGANFAFSGFMTDWAMSGGGVDGLMSASATIKISGVITMTDGSV
jgi:hypothetical protein